MSEEQLFVIEDDDDMQGIFVNLWRLLRAYAVKLPAGEDRKAWNILNDFKTRLPKVNIYYDALDLAKEFTEKIGYKLLRKGR